MTCDLFLASEKYKGVMTNLMQFYLYDFSEFIECDVKEDGLFRAYPYLEDYWKEENHRFPYLIMKDQKYIGFVLVRFIESDEKNIFQLLSFS